MGCQVDDIDAAVRELKKRGVVFEEVDLPRLRTVDGIAEVEGNYPSAGGIGERAAWFRESEGNLMGVGQAIAPEGCLRSLRAKETRHAGGSQV
jgi:hypothetical protein